MTSAEVFQEVLHRYTLSDRRDAIEPAFAMLREVVDEGIAVTEVDVVKAKELVQAHPHLSARDAIHIAVMRHHRIAEILSFAKDKGFDAVSGIRRSAESCLAASGASREWRCRRN